jgi:hypothetical protein
MLIFHISPVSNSFLGSNFVGNAHSKLFFQLSFSFFFFRFLIRRFLHSIFFLGPPFSLDICFPLFYFLNSSILCMPLVYIFPPSLRQFCCR